MAGLFTHIEPLGLFRPALLRGRPATVSIAIVMTAGMLVGSALGAGSHVILQKGREFQPGQILIKRGETIEFVNDDGDLLHHVYLKADKFSFDSGDQEPGAKLNVVFPQVGNFTVLCAIHPKMKLVVQVN